MASNGTAPKTPQDWLFDHSLGQMTTVGKQIGLAGVVFLLTAVMSVLINLGASDGITIKLLFIEAEVENVFPLKGLLFLTMVGSFVALMYCFVIFAVLQATTQYLSEANHPRAKELFAFITWAAKKHGNLLTQITIYRVLLVVLSCLILLLATATLILSLF